MGQDLTNAGSAMSPSNLPPLPPILLFLGLGLVAGMHFLLPGLDLLPQPLPPLGALLAVGSGVLALTAGRELRRRQTTFGFSCSTALVTSGVFRHTRNPMYLSILLLHLGAALVSANLAALAVPLATFLVLDRLMLPREEARLETLFDREFLDYKARTRRWL